MSLYPTSAGSIDMIKQRFDEGGRSIRPEA
jgi:hypothetical protein